MQLTQLCPDVAAWLQTLCQLFFLLLTMQPACSSGHMEDPWEKKIERGRKAICALVLKVGIIQPSRFNGYSSWLTNNLLCLHYFVYVFPYEKQRMENKDQRLQMQLCFQSQNAFLPSNNRKGFYGWASDSQCTLACWSK